MSVELSRCEQAAILTLNRPEALNALSFEIIHQLEQLLNKVAESDARVLIVTGAGGKAFCAGADIGELRGRDQMAQRQGAVVGQATFAKLDTLPIPSIAMINGYAFGGGLELAMACTFRLATANAKMAQPEIKLGLIPGYGGTQRLPAIVGQALALEMIMTGRTIDAEEALQAGLVSRIVEGEPIAAAIEFATAFVHHSLPVMAYAREAVLRAAHSTLQDGLKIEADLSTLAFQTQDAEEGMAAFSDKRKAKFIDG